MVKDIMHTGSEIPIVRVDTKLSDALLEMSVKGMGMTTVVDDNNILQGVFTDGDLRRAIDHSVDIHHTAIAEVMSHNCKTATAEMLAAETLRIMDECKISVLAVVDDKHQPIGAIHLHDLLKAGIA